jgi:hypothetical protein
MGAFLDEPFLQHQDREVHHPKEAERILSRISVFDPGLLHLQARSARLAWHSLVSGAGAPVIPGDPFRRFRAMVGRAGLPRSRLYSLRYCHATHLARQGAPVTVTQSQLGHRSSVPAGLGQHVCMIAKATLTHGIGEWRVRRTSSTSLGAPGAGVTSLFYNPKPERPSRSSEELPPLIGGRSTSNRETESSQKGTSSWASGLRQRPGDIDFLKFLHKRSDVFGQAVDALLTPATKLFQRVRRDV